MRDVVIGDGIVSDDRRYAVTPMTGKAQKSWLSMN